MNSTLLPIESARPGKLSAFAPYITLFFITYCITAIIAVVVFRDYTFSMDEYGYLFQAKLFAAGKLYMHRVHKFMPLVEWHMILQDEKYFSKYPPGFAAILSLGCLLGVPVLVNPFLSSLSVVILFATLRSRISHFPAFCTGLLLSTNCYFLGYGSSYFSQPLALFLTACGFYGLNAYHIHGKQLWLRCAALCVAVAFLVRPLDAFCLFLALCTGYIFNRKPKKLKDIALLLVIAGSGIGALFLYNYIITDKFSIYTYPVWDGEFKVIYPEAAGWINNLMLLWKDYYRSLKDYVWPNFTNEFLHIIGPEFLSASLAGLIIALAACMLKKSYYQVGYIWACVVLIFLLVALYNFHFTDGYPLYGSRYWYPVVVPLTILASCTFQLAYSLLPKWLFALIIPALLFWQGMTLHEYLVKYNKRFDQVNAVQADIERRCPAPSIVILHRSFINYYIRLDDFKRNPSLSASRLYLFDRKGLEYLRTSYPHYAICDYSFTRFPKDLE